MKIEKEIKLDNLSFFCGIAHFNCIIKELNQSDVDKLLKLKNEDRIKLTLESEEPILDEAERKYLSGVIAPFRDRVKCIIKKKSYDYDNREYIVIHAGTHETTPFPYKKRYNVRRDGTK